MPILEIVLINSFSEQQPELSRSKYLNALRRTVSSVVYPDDLSASLFLSSFSKLSISISVIT
jgi:hypothetical protein